MGLLPTRRGVRAPSATAQSGALAVAQPVLGYQAVLSLSTEPLFTRPTITSSPSPSVMTSKCEM